MGGYGKGGAPVDDAQVVAVRDDAHDRADELRGVLLAAARARRGALSHRAAGPETALEPPQPPRQPAVRRAELASSGPQSLHRARGATQKPRRTSPWRPVAPPAWLLVHDISGLAGVHALAPSGGRTL